MHRVSLACTCGEEVAASSGGRISQCGGELEGGALVGWRLLLQSGVMSDGTSHCLIAERK